MSDISINISFSNDPPPQRTVTEKRKRINRRFRKKQQHFRQGRNNRTHSHSGQSSYDQNPLHNGEASKHPPLFSLAHADTTTSASHCSSRPSKPTCTLPSWTPTVNTKGSHEKSKESVKTKSATTNPGPSASSSHKVAPTKYLAIDCEMVGTGPKGSISQLARCSIVSYEGDVVYDKFIKPSVPVTDYRTRWSGIRYSDLIKATPYSQARKEILRLLMGKVVIGHAIHNDFKVLSYSHPAAMTRDTSRIPLLNLKAGFSVNECASLKRLTKAIFNHDIQTGKKGHSSVEDAQATMELYKVVEEEWERRLASKPPFTQ